MSVAREIHENDVGTRFQAEMWDTETDTAVDLTTSTTLEIIFKFSDDSKDTRTATIVNPPGTDGLMEYLSVGTDLSPTGKLEWQGHVVLETPAGDWRSEVHEDVIHPNL